MIRKLDSVIRIIKSINQLNQSLQKILEFKSSAQMGFLNHGRVENPIASTNRRYWSQANEDGILENIFKRINLPEQLAFIEFGSGDGTENNTLALLATGAKGGWVDGRKLNYSILDKTKLSVRNEWVTQENIIAIANSVLEDLNSKTFDLISMDLDGNDYHFLSLLLPQFKSSVVVLEYNGRFPLDAEWVMPYDPSHSWAGDDYFGASFKSYCKLLEKYGYFLVACSAQGSNAFFVRSDYRKLFADVPNNQSQIFIPPSYFLVNNFFSQEVSTKTVISIINRTGI